MYAATLPVADPQVTMCAPSGTAPSSSGGASVSQPLLAKAPLVKMLLVVSDKQYRSRLHKSKWRNTMQFVLQLQLPQQ